MTDTLWYAPRVGIVILNWLRPDDVLDCLGSLARLDYPSYEIVVVDNGADPAAGSRIRCQFPRIRLIENGRNVGFAAGNNIGITYLLSRGAQYILLLNDDTAVAPDLLRRLVEVGESDPRIGVVGPTIYYYGDARRIWSAGGAVDRLGQARHLKVDELDDGRAQPVTEVDYVTGCALLIKRPVIEQVGLLDERFFAYFEETEWCARVRRGGFRVVCVPGAQVWHKIQPTARSRSRLYLYLMARNRLLYLQSCHASRWVLVRAAVNLARTAASWSIRPRHRELRPMAPVLLRAIYDFAAGHLGAPPARLLSR